MLLADHHKIALTLPGISVTYAQLLASAHSFARLFAAGTKRVLIFSENRPEWIYALYAAWCNRSTVVPVDHQATIEEIAFIIRDCQPQVFFCSLERKALLKEVLAGLDYAPQLLVFEELQPAQEPDLSPIELVDPQATALLSYTSGTTGTPKGVMLSFANLLANVEAVTIGTPIYSRDERVLMLLPLHHILPLLGTMVIPFRIGATVALSPSLLAKDIVRTLSRPPADLTIRKSILNYWLIIKPYNQPMQTRPSTPVNHSHSPVTSMAEAKRYPLPQNGHNPKIFFLSNSTIEQGITHAV